MHCTRGALDQGGAFHDSICHLVSDNGPQTLDSNGFQTAHHRQFDLSIVLDLEESKVLVQDNNGEMVHISRGPIESEGQSGHPGPA